VEAITIACMVNSVYRRRFIPEKSIAILPTCGYQPFRRYYAKAIQWLGWMMHREDVNIQIAGNGGEVCIDKYRVDGFGNRVLVIRMHVSHCETCFPNREAFHHISKNVTFEKSIATRMNVNATCSRKAVAW